MTAKTSDLASFLHAVADPARRRIMDVLKRKRNEAARQHTGLSATDVEERLKLSQPTISHHMRILENAGLVEVKKQGHWRLYRRNEKKISALLRELKRNL